MSFKSLERVHMRSLRGFFRIAPMTVLLLAAPAARAADSSGAFAVKGIGAQTCKNFTIAYDKHENGILLFGSWVDGYLTSVNRYKKDVFDIAPWESMEVLMALVASHCRQRPNEHLFDVVHRLAEFLFNNRLAARDQTTEAQVGKDKVQLYTEVMKRVQQKLIDDGFLKGVADGAYGPKTQTALEAYQAKQGLKKTGLPDQPTMVRMFLEKPAPGNAPKTGLTTTPQPKAPTTGSQPAPKLNLNLMPQPSGN